MAPRAVEGCGWSWLVLVLVLVLVLARPFRPSLRGVTHRQRRPGRLRLLIAPCASEESSGCGTRWHNCWCPDRIFVQLPRRRRKSIVPGCCFRVAAAAMRNACVDRGANAGRICMYAWKPTAVTGCSRARIWWPQDGVDLREPPRRSGQTTHHVRTTGPSGPEWPANPPQQQEGSV